MNPKVSIILPTYNGAKNIEKAIRSVLSQSYKNWELLIIDDGSTDNIKTVILPYIKNEKNIIYIKNDQNLGIQKSLNLGLGMANGEYVARIDDDDEWVSDDKLEKQISFLENNKDFVIVGTNVNIVDNKGTLVGEYALPEEDQEIRNKIFSKNCFVHSSVVFRREIALSFGGYDEGEETKHIEDYHLWLLLGQKGKMANLRERMVNFRKGEGSISDVNKIAQLKKNISLIKMFKGFYPNYNKAIFLRRFIVLSYWIFNFLPNNLKNFLIRKYKSF